MSENEDIPKRSDFKDLPTDNLDKDGDGTVELNEGDKSKSLSGLKDLKFDWKGKSIKEIAKNIPGNFKRKVKKVGQKLKKTLAGETVVGKILAKGKDVASDLGILPGWINKATDAVGDSLKDEPKTDSDMNWIKNRLSEKSTWRGIIAVLTAVGVGFSPDQKEAIVVAGVALVGVFEAFFKEPQSQDA